MSTKTLRKRIALVAVSAMGFGLLSSVGAHAADYAAGGATLTASAAGISNSGICSTFTGETTTAALAKPIQNGGTQSFTVVGTNGRAEITGNGEWKEGSAGGTLNSTKKTFTLTVTAQKVVLAVKGTGLITVKWYATPTSTTALDTFYFLGVDSCVSGVSAAKSYIQANAHATKTLTLANIAAGLAPSDGGSTTNAAGAMDNSNDYATTFANDATGYLHINTNDSYGVPYTTSSTLSVSCSNNATVGGTKGGYYVATAQTDAFYDIAVVQPTSGTSLTTTCSIAYNGVTLGSRTLKFLGDLASIKAELYKVGDAEAAAGGNQYGLIKYYYYDAAGNSLTSTGRLPSLTSSTISAFTNLLVTTDGAATQGSTVRDAYGADQGASERSGRVAFNCLDFGTSKITIKATNAVGATVTSNIVDATCGGAVFSYSAALDKSTYKTGEIATLTITGKNYAGGIVNSNSELGAGVSVALGGMDAVKTIAAADKLTDGLAGTWVYQFKVGQTDGSYAGSVNFGTLPSAYASVSPNYNKPVTLSYTITPSSTGVTNAEVLAAIVKLIASINKQIAALQKALTKKK